MKYTDKIHFANVKDFQGQISAGPLSVNNNYTVTGDNPDDATITKISQKVINAVDIDWNEACFNVYGTTFEDPKYKIRTTGDLLDTLRECIDTSYTRANTAFDLASQASTGMTEEQIRNYIDGKFRQIDYVSNLDINNKHNPKTGWVNLTSYSNISYIPVNVHDLGNSGIGFSVNKSDIPNTSITPEQLAGLAGEGLEYDNGQFNVNIELPESINYNAGEGINIDDHVISVDTDFIEEYIDSNSITGLYVSAPIKLSTSSGNPEIGIKYDEAYFTTKKLKDTDTVESLTLTDEIINKINSAGGQGIEYTSTSDSGITVNNTNHTISIDNTVALKSEIPNVSNYVKIGTGSNEGNLAVVNELNKTVTASDATISGSDIYISSDRKLKDNILDIRQDEVDKLFATESGNMHYFEWRESHKPSFGFIAQELMDFAPETVTKDSEYMQVNYNAALTKTCAALFKKIKELENRIQKLENK